MNIPIQNLYYLLLYAWDALEEGQMVEASAQSETQILDLLGGVLSSGIDHILRRGLDRGYLPHSELIPGIRGKIDISATVKANALPCGRVVCEFDELSYRVLQNQLLRSTVQRLLKSNQLAPMLRDKLAGTDRRLHEVGNVPLSSRVFRSVQLHSNNRFYRFLLEVCRLIHDNLLVDERTGTVKFRDFVRDERRMWMLFERFAWNFYRREQTTFSVGRNRVRWKVTTGTPEAVRLLPTMLTDISLTSADRKIVIETKFYRRTLDLHFEKHSVRSTHLCQLFAYLKNLAARGGLYASVEGILLYPAVGQNLDLSYDLHGHRVRVCTIDLNKGWNEIKMDMLSILTLPVS